MTFAFSSPLRTAIYEKLTKDEKLSNMVGQAIYEAAPYGRLSNIYILFGNETVSNNSDITGQGAIHDFFINIHSTDNSFKKSQAIATHICAILPMQHMTLSTGTLVKLLFLNANMRRYEKSQRRRIDLQFRAFVRS